MILSLQDIQFLVKYSKWLIKLQVLKVSFYSLSVPLKPKMQLLLHLITEFHLNDQILRRFCVYSII